MNENKITYEDTGMFAMIPHTFIEESKKLKVHTKWLYVALVYYRNHQSGVAFPSYDTIQLLTGLRREMISKGLAELEKEDWIKKRKRFGNSNVYRVVLNREGKKYVKKEKVKSSTNPPF